MDKHYSRHAGTINAVKQTGSGMDFYEQGDGSLVILTADHNGAPRAISSAGEFYSDPAAHLGERVVQVKQGSGKDKEIGATVTGYVSKNGEHFGEVPDKTVQFFVYK